MALSASGDLVLDVVRAADPAAAAAAPPPRAPIAPPTQGAAFDVAAEPSAATPADRSGPTAESFVRFEAMVLQSFLQTMLPKDTEAVYGEGMAGEMWQSLLAEQLGATMAKRGGIGIADRILRDHYADGENKVPVQGVSADPDKPALDEQRLLSTALVHEIQRRAAQSLDEQVSASTDERR